MDLVEALEARGIRIARIIAAAQDPAGRPSPACTWDDRDAAYEITEHLIQPRPPADRLPVGQRGTPLQRLERHRLRAGVEGLRHHPGPPPGGEGRPHLRRRLPRRTPLAALREPPTAIFGCNDDRRRRRYWPRRRSVARAVRTVDRRFRGRPVLAPVVAGADHRQAGDRRHRGAMGADADRQPATTARTRSPSRTTASRRNWWCAAPTGPVRLRPNPQ